MHSRRVTEEGHRMLPMRPSLTLRLAGVVALVMLIAAACSATNRDPATIAAVADCADVIDGEIERSGAAFRVTATVRSGDTGWDRYADAWEVRSPDGAVLGTRVLAHPHVDEQPFTRSLDGVAIPRAVESVEIAAHDSVVGFCGETLILAVPAR
jgi:hypothetical protein